MIACLCALALALGSALAAAVLPGGERPRFRAATFGTLAACATGLAGAVAALLSGAVRSARAPWTLPFGEVVVGIDPLSAFFVACACAVAGLAALHGLGSLPGRRIVPDTAGAAPVPRRLARGAALQALTLAAVIAVALARDGVFFLVAWEVMTIASWLLVGLDEERAEARRAAMTYLIASHAGAALLYVVFALLASHAGGYGFEAIAAAGPMPPALAGTVFGLSVAGFGAKAGFFPLHVWVPDAYPAASPPAAAFLSGALSKMGIYGILRVLLLVAPADRAAPPGWWGAALVGVGAVTAALGALNALARNDLKRLVAYSSMENLGIVALGVGLGLLGRAHDLPLLAWLGFAGALLHVLNHGVMKALLLLLAGDVHDATGTRNLDRLGGLAARMPRTAVAFLIGAVAISGLPPGNGFVSEWLILTGGLRGVAGLSGGAAVACALAVVSLALAGGVAGAAFVKAYGAAFLGAPRTPDGAAAADPRGPAFVATSAAAAFCAVLGLTPALALALPGRVAALLAGDAGPAAAAAAPAGLAWVAALLAVLVGGLVLLRRALLRGREVRTGPVWGCGYEAVGPRMQYTASGFPDPLTGPLGGAVARTVEREGPDGYFPPAARYLERPADAAGERFVAPLVRRFVATLGRAKALQAGRLQLYLLYVLATLVLLLAWELVIAP
jgi:formate hydrogenlyase subunit 3/multisubunit Na+/H+ antiporter MnhD subunit